MLTLKANNFYDAAKPIHLFSQIFGLTAFTVRREGNTLKFVTTSFNVACVIISMIRSFTIYFMLYFGFNWETGVVLDSKVYSTFMMVLMFSFTMVSVSVNWWTFAAKKSFSNIFNLMDEVDEELSVLKNSVNLEKHKLYAYLGILCTVSYSSFTLMMIIYMTRDQVHNALYYTFIVSLFLSTMLDLMFIIHYVLVVASVKVRYRKINLLLNKIFSCFKIEKEKSGNDQLIKAALLHDKLVDATQHINSCFGFPVSKD